MSLFVVMVCVGGFGFDARDSSGPVLFDRSVDAFLTRASGLEHQVAVLLSDFGDPAVFLTITAVAVGGLVLLRDYRAAGATLGSVGFALLLVEGVLKPFFSRHLGDSHGATFPSGHTTVAVALATAITLATRGNRPLGRLLGRILRDLLMSAAVTCALGIGVAMVALRFHYMTDVVAGLPLGVTVTGSLAVLLDVLAGRPAR